MVDEVLEQLIEMGWEYWGPLQCTGQLVVADPAYVGSEHAQVEDDAKANFVVKARPGTWHVLVRRAPPDKAKCEDVEIWELCVCHETTLLADFEIAYDDADERAAIIVDSGKASVVDAELRDDAAFREDVFWGREGETVANAGCTVLAGTGIGAYPVFTTGSDPVDFVLVVFEWDDDEE
ncbi:MAG: hypothetical protein JRI23_06970 [Deltaproteobacteria bacterium]|jgi:hypothetical protein|nr:hypothetical protein [Deltaproteobacteria bacterium]MBW2531329.1 hypothetical protein [Deltaproteobacteria bacterium]